MVTGEDLPERAGGGEVVTVSRACHDGCQIFQNPGLCVFLFKVRLLCAAVGDLWSISRHLTPLSRTLFILLLFQRHLSKLPSTHSG